MSKCPRCNSDMNGDKCSECTYQVGSRRVCIKRTEFYYFDVMADSDAEAKDMAEKRWGEGDKEDDYMDSVDSPEVV